MPDGVVGMENFFMTPGHGHKHDIIVYIETIAASCRRHNPDVVSKKESNDSLALALTTNRIATVIDQAGTLCARNRNPSKCDCIVNNSNNGLRKGVPRSHWSDSKATL